MSVDFTSCALSTWDGDVDNCRMCNRLNSRRRHNVFHSKRCERKWYENHIYRKARLLCRLKSRFKCQCDTTKLHVICYECGKCESEVMIAGEQLECHHIEPLRGSKHAFTCLNHQDNLLMCCTSCHKLLTEEQNIQDFIVKMSKR